MATMATVKNIQKHHCKTCDFKCSKLGDWNRHIITSKHIIGNIMATKNTSITSNIQKYKCDCGKEYMDRTGLWRHKKKCIVKLTNESTPPTKALTEGIQPIQDTDIYDYEYTHHNNLILEIMKQNQDFKEMILEKPLSDDKDPLVMELLKQNQEFKELMIEQNKYMMEQNKHMIELAKNAGHNTINNTSNKFNLQFFLNETCKDAMNITDFVNSLVLDFEDLENMGHLGYVEGISRIFLRGIRGMDVTKRPFHCSDVKRETMFVKELEGWEKENSDNEKMTTTIKRIACKNLRQATAWMAAHQKAIADTDSKPHSQYMKMMSQCLGGSTAAEDKSNYNKIIKRVAQEVFIDKNKD